MNPQGETAERLSESPPGEDKKETAERLKGIRGILEHEHGETNPYFRRPTDRPPEEQLLWRPGWLRPPRTADHPPRDPLPPAKDQDDHDSVQQYYPTVVVVPPLQPTGGVGLRRPKAQEEPFQPKTPRLRWVQLCTAMIFWVFIIIAALALLIIYLMFRPWCPQFGISTVTTLNGLSTIEKGNLLSANLTLVINFTNPNKKAIVDFKYVVVELYFGRTIIASNNIGSDLSAPKGVSRSVEVGMVASRVQLDELKIQMLKRQMVKDRVVFEVRGTFLVQTKFGNFVRYSYWMHGQCIVTLKKPPHGVLDSTQCNTKRD